MFNLRVPLEARDEVFLMNTLTDAQLVVSPDVAALLDRAAHGDIRRSRPPSSEEREALDLLRENGFLVESRDADRRALDNYLAGVKSDTAELNVTVLTTLQCNFACDYCFQGDHGDYNKFADKMSLETAARVADWIERELDRVRPRAIRPDVLRRRAAAQPAGDVRAGRAAVARRAGARRRRCSSTSSPTACCSRPRSSIGCCRSG